MSRDRERLRVSCVFFIFVFGCLSPEAPRAQEASVKPVAFANALVALKLGEEQPVLTLHFGNAAVEPLAASLAELRRFARALAENVPADFTLRVSGHADSTGSSLENLIVSRKRAEGVAAVLRDEGGVPGGLIEIEGLGESDRLEGLAADDPANRRVVISLTRMALPVREVADWDAIAAAPAPEERMGFRGAPGDVRQFSLSDERLTDAAWGTIDFWVSPDWREEQGHDPTILAFGDQTGTRFSVHITEGRDALALWDGSEDGYVAIRHDFRSPGPFHVALVTIAGETRVAIDGELVDPPLPVEYGTLPADRLTIGGLTTGEERFTGRVARVRVMSTVMLPQELLALRYFGPSDVPNTTFAWKLVAETRFDDALAAFELEVRPADLTPLAGWWSTLGDQSIHIRNPAEFREGSEPPLFSSFQKTWRDARAGGQTSSSAGDDAAEIVNAAGDVLHPHFSTRPLFKATTDTGLDVSRYAMPEEFESSFAATFNPFGNGMTEGGWAIHVTERMDGISHLSFFGCPAGRPCRRGRDSTLVPLSGHERLVGLRWDRTEAGSMRNLVFYTNRRILGPYGNALPEDEGGPSQTFEQWMPEGVSAESFVVHYGSLTDPLVTAVEAVVPAAISRPAVTLYSDAGLAVRFSRVAQDRFESVDVWPMPFAAHGAPAIFRPALTVVDERLMQVGGITDDLIFLPAKGRGDRTTGINDTFVSLSKAVNLQASYMGYDILRMDPLHLTRTGTQRPIFAMPTGASHDYYDANRIFVPKGLLYAPEYNGKNHATVTTSDSYASYKDAFSDTVSAGVGGKLAPVSFSLSSRMSEARETINENKVTRTLGLSKAVFYDLVLDKSHMQLDEHFVEQVERLRQTGNHDSFIGVFGTHYPAGVVYGGLGVLEIDFTERMRSSLLRQGIGIKMETSFLLDASTKTSASFGLDHEEEHEKAFRNTVGSQTENFYWIGGTHAGVEHNSWSVGTDGVVPVHVALRPIDELLSPVFFPDPDIHVRVRLELKRAIETYLKRVEALIPQGEREPEYYLEARLDKVTCGSVQNDGIFNAVQGQGGAGAATGGRRTRMFPTFFFVAMQPKGPGGRNVFLRNFDQPDDVDASAFVALEAGCPSHLDLTRLSPLLAANRIGRFRIDLDNPPLLTVLDHRPYEHVVLYPPKAALDKGEAFWQGFLAGITAGISIGIQELTLDDGSPLVNHDDGVPEAPGVAARPVGPSLPQIFCSPDAAGNCPPLDRQVVEEVAGRWHRQEVPLPAPNGCTYCVDYTATVSVRILH